MAAGVHRGLRGATLAREESQESAAEERASFLQQGGCDDHGRLDIPYTGDSCACAPARARRRRVASMHHVRCDAPPCTTLTMPPRAPRAAVPDITERAKASIESVIDRTVTDSRKAKAKLESVLESVRSPSALGRNLWDHAASGGRARHP